MWSCSGPEHILGGNFIGSMLLLQHLDYPIVVKQRWNTHLISHVVSVWSRRGVHVDNIAVPPWKLSSTGWVRKDLHLRVNRPFTDQMAVVGIWIFHYVEQSKTFRRRTSEKERCLQSQYRHVSNLACSTIVSQRHWNSSLWYWSGLATQVWNLGSL